MRWTLFKLYEKVNRSINDDEPIQLVPPNNLFPMCSWDEVMWCWFTKFWFVFLSANKTILSIFQHCIGNSFTIRGYIQSKGYAILYLLSFFWMHLSYILFYSYLLHTLFFRRSNCKYLQSLIVMQNFLYTPMYHQVKVAPSASVAFILDVPMLFMYCPKAHQMLLLHGWLFTRLARRSTIAQVNGFTYADIC